MNYLDVEEHRQLRKHLEKQMNKISYAEFVAQVKELQMDDALSTDLDLIRNNPHWASVLISDLLEAAE